MICLAVELKVINASDCDHTPYQLPLSLHRENVDPDGESGEAFVEQTVSLRLVETHNTPAN
jgi:hypothetical protein